MSKKIAFKIAFITPLLIGGAKKLCNEGKMEDSCDPLSLGKALRGGWRFWFRAVCGGMLKGTDAGRGEALRQLENEVFGSTRCAKFRLLVTQGLYRGIMRYPRCPHKTDGGAAKREACKEESTFEVIILPRGSMHPDTIQALLAAVWLWSNLGSAGNRARRGFGSPFLLNGGEPFKEFPQTEQSTFQNRDTLITHLKDGIAISISKIEKFVKAHDLSSTGTSVPSTPLTGKTDFFVLRDGSQVMVSDTPSAYLFTSGEMNNSPLPAIKGLINQIHGMRSNLEIGDAVKRQASPVYVRIHNTENGYYPVATWSQQKITPSGSPPNTAKDYIKTNLICSKNILGISL